VGELWHLLRDRLGDTEFLGYQGDGHEGEGTIQALVKDGREVPELRADEAGELVTDRTPFYGEAGGQVGDTGRIVGHGGKAEAQVLGCRPESGLLVHSVKVSQGTLRVGDLVQLSVDGERRKAIRANHSATHLLHRALKIVLGDHVKQAGSVVAPDYLRFDYAHFSPTTAQQLEQVEDLVNGWIRDNAGAETKVMALDEAKRSGAVALFGEKYGDRVRVVSVHPQSTELCGGTHVRRTGDIGLFKITSENGIASGVRRIVALTGVGAMGWVREMEHEMRRASEALRTSPKELSKRVEATQRRVKELEKEVETAAARATATASRDVLAEAHEVNGIRVVSQRLDPADAKAYRSLADQLRDRMKSGVVVVWGEKDGKGLVLVGATKDVVARGFSAADAVQKVSREAGGSGGGKPDLAQAGGADPARLGSAVENMLTSVGA
jgi:alanyl-tRNA synthetase